MCCGRVGRRIAVSRRRSGGGGGQRRGQVIHQDRRDAPLAAFPALRLRQLHGCCSRCILGRRRRDLLREEEECRGLRLRRQCRVGLSRPAAGSWIRKEEAPALRCPFPVSSVVAASA